MTFAGRVWRLLVGIKDALVLIFMLLFFWVLFAVLTARPTPAQIHGGALVIDLDGYVVEEAARIDPFSVLLNREAPTREFEERDIVRALDAAAADPRITAVVLDLDRFLGGGQEHMQAIGAALDRVRAAKKPVLTYATAYANSGLMLAAHASEVWMNPMGGSMIAGPGGTHLYYKTLIDKLKINAHIYRVGTYKSAVEPYFRDSMSDAARENYTALYGALWSDWLEDVAKARPQAKIQQAAQDPLAWVNASGGDLAQASLKSGLVDKLGTRDDFDQRLIKLVGADSFSDKRGAFASTDYDDWLESLGAPSGGAAIGVVTIAGDIVDGDAGPGTAGGDRIADLLDKALNQDIKALVVRVDSPGGSVLASEEIRQAILRQKARGIPVAVSMANVAASGGYWVSTAGDRIFAQPETITGSIGIFAVIPSFENTGKWIGVNADGVRTTPLSGQPDVFGGFTPAVDGVIQATIDNGYRQFLGRVAEARKMTPESVDKIGQGRVWDGGSARQIGLVDQFGGMGDALAWAAAKAGLKDGGWHPVYLGEPEPAYETVLKRWLERGQQDSQQQDMMGMIAARERSLTGRLSADLDRLLGGNGMQAYCLECAPMAAPPKPVSSNTRDWLALLGKLFSA